MLRRARPLLGTLVEVACAGDTALALRGSSAAFAAVQRVHSLMSFQESGSDVGRLNHAPVGCWLDIAADTLAVLQTAQLLSGQTGGVFDVCATGSAGCWRDLELDAAACRVRRHAAVLVDLSGIAKGYAVDCAVDALGAAGVLSGLVNAGGDLRVFGAQEHALWVRAPWDVGQGIFCTTLHNRAAASSASYFVGTPVLRDGVTRRPVDSGASWTVLASTCMVADMLTKVVAATGDARHPVLARWQAEAWLYDAAPRAHNRDAVVADSF